jgi:predicted nucleic acid-binding protein
MNATMVLVDTSIWISAFSSGTESFRSRYQLELLLEHHLLAIADPIRFEILMGVASEHRLKLLASLNALNVLPLKASTWGIATQIGWELANRELVFERGDPLIVALALQHQLPLLTLSSPQKAVAGFRKLCLLE